MRAFVAAAVCCHAERRMRFSDDAAVDVIHYERLRDGAPRVMRMTITRVRLMHVYFDYARKV